MDKNNDLHLGAVTRYVTGSDDSGRSYLAGCSHAPSVPIKALPGLVFHEIWRTGTVPTLIDHGIDDLGPLKLSPDAGGIVVRVCDIPPDSIHAHPDVDIAAHFKEMGMQTHDVNKDRDSSEHALMHQTETVDFGMVISGEIWMVLDDGETRLKPGDIVVQRGTRHAWSNRTGEVARMVFVLIDGKRKGADL